ncbi:MAG TPA: dTDP-4-dehydrorhamnose reductase [Microbacteriaceae bacterium]|nr:dTDP-4-dehydrorhamnose reductase [Microbacteriaceae bacterium]
MRYLITGANGMLAQDLAAVLHGRDVRKWTRAEWDIANPQQAKEFIRPADVVFNCAAYNRVDDAQTHRDDAFRVNADGPRVLAEACATVGATLVHVSTDYVFGTDSGQPHHETDTPDPMSVYGASKAAGERAVLDTLPDASYVIRTAWLYGAHGKNFGRTILHLLDNQDSVSVVNDQWGQPTWTRDLAELARTLVDNQAPAGVYHGTNSGETTWHGFASLLATLTGRDSSRVEAVPTEAFPRPAPRPRYSVLGHNRWREAGIDRPRSWESALREAVEAGVFSAE